MDQYHDILKQAQSTHAASLLRDHGLICRQIPFGKESEPLYLAKEHWTNRFDEERESTIGIFCAIWVSKSLLDKQQFAYNIHSKQLRKLPGYALESRDFADQFRALVKTRVASGWPGIRLDYGPTTLLEGREHCEPESFPDKVAERIAGFVDISKQIDLLLEAGSKRV